MNLATADTRPHPGGGSEGHRRPKAEEAGARGIPPPTNYLITIGILYFSLSFLTHNNKEH
jgi:hypothetical protein